MLCRPDRQRIMQYISLLVGIFVMALSGSLFSFASFSTDLKERFGFTSSHINLLSAIGDTSMYVGFIIVGPVYDHLGERPTMITASVLTFLGYGGMAIAYAQAWGGLGFLMLLYCLAGIASTAGYLAALAVNMSNFPSASAGTISGVLLAFFGLSATLFSQLKTNLFSGEGESEQTLLSGSRAPLKGTLATQNFLLFLTVITTAIYIVAAVLMVKVKKDTLDTKQGLAGKSGPTDTESETCTLATTKTLSRQDCEKCAGVTKHPPDMRLDTCICSYRSPATTPSTPLQKPKYNPFQVPIEMKPRALLTESTFWLFVLAQVLQQGFSYINNIDSIIHALLDASDTAAPAAVLAQAASATKAARAISLTGLHVTFISVGNCLGRLVTGILSDHVISRYRVSRSVFFLASEILLLVPLLIMSFSSPGLVSLGALVATSCMIGATYGSTGALFASMTRDFFGNQYYGSVCGMVMVLNGFNPFIANQIYGLFYDRATESFAATARAPAGLNITIKTPFLEGESVLATAAIDQQPELCRAGASCYEVSFRIASSLQVACILAAALLFLAHMRKGRRMIQDHAQQEKEQPQKYSEQFDP